jgi:deoxyhypusine synthase
VRRTSMWPIKSSPRSNASATETLSITITAHPTLHFRVAAGAGSMAFEADDFDLPVRDYDFTDISAADAGEVSGLLDAMATAGGFSATKLACARDILRDMFAALDDAGDKEGYKHLNWLSFPASLCATGTRGFFVEALKRNRFNVVVTTCGTLDHDIARTHAEYYHGSFELDDVKLGEQGLNRLGNVIVPNSSYGETIEEVMLPMLAEIEEERRVESPEDPWRGFGSVELCWAIGDRIEDEASLLHHAARRRIPLVIPGIYDGAVGAQLFMHRQRSSDFRLDLLADQQILSDLVWTADASHALIVGGGISKHHVIWWNQYRGGLDSAVQISTAPEHDGSLSGARLREAVSWGKVRPEAPQVVVEGDASVLLPLLGVDLFRD